MIYKGAIFDLDGTLLDTMPVWSGLCGEFMMRHGVDEPADIEGKLAVLSIRHALEYILANYPIELELEDAVSETWQIVESFYREKAEIKPGIPEILKVLKEASLPSAIITATEMPLVEVALKRVGLYDHFAGKIFSCADLQTSKREPEIFLTVAEKLNSSPGETLIFEDALYAARTAKAAGFPVAAVYDPSEKRPEELKRTANWYCLDWNELPLKDILASKVL